MSKYVILEYDSPTNSVITILESLSDYNSIDKIRVKYGFIFSIGYIKMTMKYYGFLHMTILPNYYLINTNYKSSNIGYIVIAKALRQYNIKKILV